MDLSALDVKKAAGNAVVCGFRHPVTDAPLKTDDDKPIGVSVLGADSDRYQELSRSRGNARLKETMKKGAKANITTESIDADALAILVGVTTEVHNVVIDGKKYANSPADIREMYEKLPWAREQVQAFVEDRANFLGN